MMSTTLTRSATMRSSTWDLSCLAGCKVASSFTAAATTPFPSSTSSFFPHNVAVRTRNLLGSRPARYAPKSLVEPSDRTMLDFRHGGAMSREGVTHRPRLSSRVHRSACRTARWSENFDVPCGVEQIVDVLGRRRNNLELACATEERDSSPAGQFFFFFVSFFFVCRRNSGSDAGPASPEVRLSEKSLSLFNGVFGSEHCSNESALQHVSAIDCVFMIT